MTYPLTTGDTLFVTVDGGFVILAVFCAIRRKPVMTLTRMKPVSEFSPGHMTMLIKLMKSGNRGDRNIGLAILQQTLKVNINGELV